MLSVTSSSLANSRPLSTWMRWISSSNSSAKVFTNFKGLFVIFSRTIVRVCFRRLKPATLHLIAQGDLCYAMFHRTQTESLTIAHFLLMCTLSCIIRSVTQGPTFHDFLIKTIDQSGHCMTLYFCNISIVPYKLPIRSILIPRPHRYTGNYRWYNSHYSE